MSVNCSSLQSLVHTKVFTEGLLKRRGHDLSPSGLESGALPFLFSSSKGLKAFREQKPHRATPNSLHRAWPPGKGHCSSTQVKIPENQHSSTSP